MICTYQDHGDEDEPEVDATTSVPQDKMDQDGSEQIVFPAKLHNMLTSVEKEGLSYVVGWAPHGRCFLVRNKSEFVSRILATWFRQSKFASFQRQLNLYGFKRITTGPDKGGYYHELFLRSKVFLCHRIDRVKIKGSKPGRIKAYADAEPDFYRMKPMPANDDSDSSDPANPPASETEGQAPPPPPRIGEAAGPARQDSSAPTANSLSFIQSNDAMSNLAFPYSKGPAISFLSGDPQPMQLARTGNSPPSVDSGEETSLDLKAHASGPGLSSDPTLALPDSARGSYPGHPGNMNTLNSMLQPTALSLSMASHIKQTEDQQAPPIGLFFSSSGNVNTETATANSSAMPNLNLHPMLQASGRTNLVNLRESNDSIFGRQALLSSLNLSGGNDQGAGGLDLPSFLSQPSVSTLPLVALPASSTTTNPSSTQMDAQMPMINMPNEFMLSQSLPTAQALALEDLFDTSGHHANASSTMAAAAAAIMDHSGSAQQNPQIQQQQQQYAQLLLSSQGVERHGVEQEDLLAMLAGRGVGDSSESKRDDPSSGMPALNGWESLQQQNGRPSALQHQAHAAIASLVARSTGVRPVGEPASAAPLQQGPFNLPGPEESKE